VFAWHVGVLDILQAGLEPFEVVRVDGRDSPASKQRKVDRFINDPKCRVIIGNILSLGTGTDGLQQVCTHALMAEPDWVHGNNVQCFDRLDRFGQTGQVQGDIFVAPDSFAEKILASALRKAQVTHKALDRRLDRP
jgi:SNF2 family DNA or RNA helicase